MKRPDANTNRQRIWDLIASRPGIHKSEICRTIHISWGTATHHIAALIANGHIRGYRIGTRVHYAPRNTGSNNGIRPSLLMPHSRTILDLFSHTNFLGPAQISDMTGLSSKTVRTHLSALRDDGILESDDGYHPRLWLGPTTIPRVSVSGDGVGSTGD